MIAFGIRENYQYVYNWITGRGVGIGIDGEVNRPAFHPDWTISVLEDALLVASGDWYGRMMLSESWSRYQLEKNGRIPDFKGLDEFFFWSCMAFARFDRMLEQGEVPDVSMLFRNSPAFALGSETTYAGPIRITRTPYYHVQPGRTLIRNYKSIAEEFLSDLVSPPVNP